MPILKTQGRAQEPRPSPDSAPTPPTKPCRENQREATPAATAQPTGGKTTDEPQSPPRQPPNTQSPYDLERIAFHWRNGSSLINGIPADEYIRGRYYPGPRYQRPSAAASATPSSPKRTGSRHANTDR